MALRLTVFMIVFIGSAFPVVGQSLNANDIINLGNQILKSIPQQQGDVRQKAPATPQTQMRTKAGFQLSVYETQALLLELGFNPGPADGVMGKRTAMAIRQFQATQGLVQSGQTSPELIARLRNSTRMRYGANTGSVASVAAPQSITPSFDCRRATTTVEMAICRSPELAQLDRALATAFNAYRNTVSSQRASGLAGEQKAWLFHRDLCGANVSCLSNIMSARIAQLGGSLPQIAEKVAPFQSAGSGTFEQGGSPSPNSPLSSQAYIVDGRYAIFDESFHSPPADIPHNVYTAEYIPALERLFDLVGIMPGDERFLPGDWPLWTGDFLGKARIRALVAEAANGVVSNDIQHVLDRPTPTGRLSLVDRVLANLANDFERQRFLALIKKSVAEFVPGLLPQGPVPVRLYCRLELKQNQKTQSPLYDFNNETFHVANFSEHCGDKMGGNTLGRTPWPAVGQRFQGGRFQPEIATQDHPATINLPPDRAEEFVNTISEHRINIGFDAELVAQSARSQNNEPITSYTIRRTGPYKLYYHSQPAKPIYEFTADQLAAKPLTAAEQQVRRLADMDRIWTFAQLDEQQVLLELAQTRGSFSADIFDGDDILTFSVRPRIGNWERVTSPVSELGLKDGLTSKDTQTVAQSLGRPQTSIFSAPIGMVGSGRSPISRVFVAIPDVLENYKRPAIETDKKLYLVVNFKMKRVWQLPAKRAKPEILIFAVPVSGAYYPADAENGVPAEPVTKFRFDDAPPVDYSDSSLARPRDILAAVAQSTGSDLVALIDALYPPSSQDAFARRDEIEDLATTADPINLGGFWMTGNGRFADFDFETQAFGFEYLNLTFSDNLSRNERRITRNQLFRLTNMDESGGIRFPMSQDEARRLQQASMGSDATFRALIIADAPGKPGGDSVVPLQARIAEIVVLQPGSDPEVEIEANILARIAIGSRNETAPTALPNAPEAAAVGAYDILDVRIRQALDTALPAAKTSFGPETVIYGRREAWVEQENLRQRVTLTTPLSEATILVRDGGNDSLTIFHEPLLPDNPVTGIARTISFAEGARPPPDAVKGLLLDKYGDMATEHKFAFDWFRNMPHSQVAPHSEMSTSELLELSTSAQNEQTRAFRCGKLLSSMTIALDFDAQSFLRTGYSKFISKPYPAVDENNAVMPLPATNPLWPVFRVSMSNPECGEDFVVAAIEPDSNGLVSVLRILVSNRGYLAEVEAKAKQALIDNNASGAGAGVVSKIKL